MKNNADFLYFKWEKLSGYTKPDNTLYDQYVYFDQNNNGILELPEDGKAGYNGDGIVEDFYWDGSLWQTDESAGGTNDGETGTNGPLPLYREMVIPLNSGDPYDMMVAPGDTIGILFYAWSGDEGDDIYYWWPQGGDPENANTYGDLILATPTPPPPPPPPVGGEVYPVNKVSLIAPWLGLALFFAAGGGVLAVRRRRAN